MPDNRNRRRRRKKNNLVPLAALLALTLLVLIVVSFQLDSRNPVPTEPGGTTSTDGTQATTQQPTTVPPTTAVPTLPPVVKEGSLTISAVGDMLMHMPVINTGAVGDGSYNLDSIFTYFSDHIKSADFAFGNLETTLAGNDNGYNYSGYPAFNCPDGIIDSMKNAGFDVILTANNHTYDTRSIGLKRTLEIIRDRELASLGTRLDIDAPVYTVVEKDGIKIGVSCYTYETDGYADQKGLNTILVKPEDAPLISSFDYKHLDLFYNELAENMEKMREQGVDAFVVFMHWGDEYQLKQNATQSEIAQQMCNLGVDVIIGGHPHVVQPVELLTSDENPEHKTVCLYSMGNAVSNQRRYNMNLNDGHTEDGVCFSVTFSRYSDGTVILENAECIPTWVDLRTLPSGKRAYCILPLDKAIADWKSAFALTDSTLKECNASFDRTQAIVGAGMESVKDYLAQHVLDVEAQIGVK